MAINFDNPYADLIKRYADQYDVPYGLMTALVGAESGFDPKQVSTAGAAGLGQFMPGTAKTYGMSEEERFDPEKNIRATANYLRDLYNKTGSWVKSVSTYNMGPENAERTGYSLASYQGYGAGDSLIAEANALDRGAGGITPLHPQGATVMGTPELTSYGGAAGIPGLAGGPGGPAYIPAPAQPAPELTSWGGAAGIPGLPGSPSGPAYIPKAVPPP